MRSLAAEKPFAEQITTHVAGLPGAELKGWMVESCIGSYPLQVIAAATSPGDGGPRDGDFLVLSIELTIDGAPWHGAAPVGTSME